MMPRRNFSNPSQNLKEMMIIISVYEMGEILGFQQHLLEIGV
jgi:hypothetical protein